MIKYLFQGFMLGMAYVAPIGMQNIYVINSAIANRKTRAYAVALITTFLDISLALACFFGIGAIMERFQSLKLAILLVGSLAVIYIGIKLIRSTPETKSEVNVNKPLTQVIMTCLLVTWANPQALIDGTLLLGGFKATLSLEASRLFILGVCLASAFWFIGITTIVSTFKNNFNSKVIKMINIICGIILVYYGLRLGFKFIEIIL